MVKTLADYNVIYDGQFELDSVPDGTVPVAKNLTFKAPKDFVQGTNIARPVLAFLIQTVSNEGRMGIWVNHPQSNLVESAQVRTLQWTGGEDRERASWECIQGDKIEPGETAQIRFGFAPNQFGTFRIRDVVMWYQRYNKGG